MKRKDIIKKLADAGYVFEEGGNHTKAFGPNGKFTAIPRHNEVPEKLVWAIEKQTGITLREKK